jgi:hypothetical protein
MNDVFSGLMGYFVHHHQEGSERGERGGSRYMGEVDLESDALVPLCITARVIPRRGLGIRHQILIND